MQKLNSLHYLTTNINSNSSRFILIPIIRVRVMRKSGHLKLCKHYLCVCLKQVVY